MLARMYRWHGAVMTDMLPPTGLLMGYMPNAMTDLPAAVWEEGFLTIRWQIGSGGRMFGKRWVFEPASDRV